MFETIDKIFSTIGKVFIILAIMYIIIFIAKDCSSKITPPVEDMNIIDSISTINDSLKIKVNNLDSIKNAKVIEVLSLDNDSTVKLFYKLVEE